MWPAWISRRLSQRKAVAVIVPPPSAGDLLTVPAGTQPVWLRPPEPQHGKWRALPGLVIELGATGFQITLDTRPGYPLYQLRSPEGAMLGYGGDLPALKAFGERLAAEREEFSFRGASR